MITTNEKPEEDFETKNGAAIWVKQGVSSIDPEGKAHYRVSIGEGKFLAIADPKMHYDLFSSQIQNLYKSGNTRKKKVGIYAGSFNPIHEGHIQIITSALKLFDEIEVTIADNPEKTYSVPASKRVEICKKVLDNDIWKNRVFVNYTTLPVAKFAFEFGKKYDVDVSLIRGIRDASDLKIEKTFSSFNKKLSVAYNGEKPFCNDVETVFFTSDPSLSLLSSTAVRNVAKVSTKEEFDWVFDCDFKLWNDLVWEAYHDA